MVWNYQVAESFNLFWAYYPKDHTKSKNITMSRSITTFDIRKDNSLEIAIDTRVNGDKSWNCPTRLIPADAAQARYYFYYLAFTA